MFFVLSKTIGIMLLPTNFLIGVGLLGAILLATRFALAWPQAADRFRRVAGDLRIFAARKLVLYPLELRFPPWDAARGAPDGIVVLGGAIDAGSFGRAWRGGVRSAADRVIAAAALARRYPNARIIFSGGSANLISDDAQGSRLRGRGVRKSRGSQSAADHGAALAQYPGERRILQGDRGAEKRRTLAAGDVGLPYAAIDRSVSEGRICRRAVSGRLAGRRPRRSPDFRRRGRRAVLRRHRHSRMDRACRLPGSPARSTSCCRGLLRNNWRVAAHE